MPEKDTLAPQSFFFSGTTRALAPRAKKRKALSLLMAERAREFAERQKQFALYSSLALLSFPLELSGLIDYAL